MIGIVPSANRQQVLFFPAFNDCHHRKIYGETNVLSRRRARVSQNVSAKSDHGFQIMSATVLPAGMNGMTCVL